jgi:hypothetical protein
MYLLYLDWNAMKGLKGIPEKEFSDFAAVLERYHDRFWIPYSSTHLDDLARGYDPVDERKVKLTNDDLSFISKLTQNRCFQAYQGQDQPQPDRRNPLEFFYSHYEDQQESKQALTSFTTTTSGPLGGLIALQELILDSPSIPFPEEAQSTMLADLFPGWSNQGTIRSIVQDMTDLTTRANTDYTYSTEMRNMVRNGLPMLKPSIVSSAAAFDVFEHIERLLAPFTGGRSMIAMMDDSLKNPTNPSKQPSLHQQFVQYYYLLDLFGYHSDKLSKKNYFPNTLGDATHAFLGGHCDFMITNDGDLRHKAKAVYHKLRTHTYVVSVAEFVAIMSNGLADYTPATLTPYLTNAVRDGIKASSEHPEAAPLGYVLPYSLFDLFNVYELRGENSITFFREEVTYRNFTLSPAIQQVVKFLDDCLGLNDAGKTELEYPLEVQQMEAGTWEGRQWSRPDSTTTLLFAGRLELTLEFGAIPPSL